MKKTETAFAGEVKSWKVYLKQYWILYLFVIPFIVGLLIFKIYPLFGIQLAFKDWDAWEGIWGSPLATTDGKLDLFKNFKLFLSDPEFGVKFMNTVRIEVLELILGFPVPILLTIFMHEIRLKQFKTVIQVILYLPHFISWVIIAGIFKGLTATGGEFQALMTQIFGKELLFFTDAKLFVAMIVASNIWKGAGWGTIIYLAAINSISPELYEAASIDGASRWKKIVHITLPGILPAISINLIFKMAGIASGDFGQIFNMYNPAVYSLGDILGTYSYRIGIGGAKYSYATAMSLFNSIIGFGLISISNFVAKKVGGASVW